MAGTHTDPEVMCSPAPGPDGLGGGGDLFEVVVLFTACFRALFCCSVLSLVENTAEHP